MEMRENVRSFVRFVLESHEDVVASRQKGYSVMKDVEMAYITPAYTKDVFKQEVPDWKEALNRDTAAGRMPESDKQFFLQTYNNWKSGLAEPVDGVPIKGWGVITPSQQENLIGMNIRTVEMLARINDEGLKRIGMDGMPMKRKAEAWLSQMNDKGKFTMEMAELKAKNGQLEDTVRTLQGQVNALMKKPSYVEDVPHETSHEISAADILDDDPVARYTAKFGKPPHHRMKPESIIAALGE